MNIRRKPKYMYVYIYCLLNDKKSQVLKPGGQKTLRLSSRTPRIPINVLSRTLYILFIERQKKHQ